MVRGRRGRRAHTKLDWQGGQGSWANDQEDDREYSSLEDRRLQPRPPSQSPPRNKEAPWRKRLKTERDRRVMDRHVDNVCLEEDAQPIGMEELWQERSSTDEESIRNRSPRRGRKRPRGRLKPGSEKIVDEIMTVPQSVLGRIIGRQGSKINEIRHVTSTRIEVSPPAKEDTVGGREILIRGTGSCVAKAKAMLSEFIQEPSSQEDWSEEAIHVPQLMLGRIIGKGGQQVRSLEEQSGAKINVDTDSCRVLVRGVADAVVHAIDLISEVMDEIIDKHPLTGDDEAAEELINVPQEMLGRFIGKGGENKKRLEIDNNVKIDVKDPKGAQKAACVKIQGPREGVKCVVDFITAILKSDEAPVEDTIDVPWHMVGQIIGKKGQTIAKVRDESGVNVDIDKERHVAHLRGSSDGVAHARNMLMALLAEGQAVPCSNGDKVDVTPDMIEEAIDVPPDLMGHIFGRRGQHIMKVQDDSGAKVDANKERNVILLRGSVECVMRARDMISALLGDRPKAFDLHRDVIEETVNVPPHLIGHIIGKQGRTIMKIQDDSGAKVDANNERSVVLVRGTSESVMHARDMIATLLAERPAASALSREGIEEMIDVPPHLIGHIFGKQGQTIMKIQDDSGAKVNIDKAEPNTVHLKGSSACVMRARDMIMALLAERGREDSHSTEDMVDVPPQILGRIFGHGGSNIMRLQEESGARITVDKANSKISLSGSSTRVARARTSINNLIAAEAGKVNETMQVSPEILGAIFGHGGQTIMSVQKASGTKIDVDKVALGSIHLSGAHESVELARAMIESLIAEAVDRAGDKHNQELVTAESRRVVFRPSRTAGDVRPRPTTAAKVFRPSSIPGAPKPSQAP